MQVISRRSGPSGYSWMDGHSLFVKGKSKVYDVVILLSKTVTFCETPHRHSWTKFQE